LAEFAAHHESSGDYHDQQDRSTIEPEYLNRPVPSLSRRNPHRHIECAPERHSNKLMAKMAGIGDPAHAGRLRHERASEKIGRGIVTEMKGWPPKWLAVRDRTERTT
jgi:hypothetical protein